MVRILSTGTAFDIAVTTGDAGQLGMAAEFGGYISSLIGDSIGDLIGRLMDPMRGAPLGDAHRTDLSIGVVLGGDRRWQDRCLGFKLSTRLRGYLAQGDRISQRYCHPLFQHSVSQH